MSPPPLVTPAPLPSAPKPKPGLLLLVGTTLLVLLNMWLGFAKTMRESGDTPEALGAATAQFVVPVIVASLFSINPRFRNARARTKIVFWTSVLVLLGTIGSLGPR